MKPLPLFLALVFLIVIIAVILPPILRVAFSKEQNLPVTVTSLGTALEDVLQPTVPILEAPIAARNTTRGAPTMVVPGYPGLTDFAASVVNGNPYEVVGIYSRDQFALAVRQQPTGQADYVAREHNLVTQFSLPAKYGSIGLLAHNYLSGSRFFQLQPNHDVVVVFGDGRLAHYRIKEIDSFQALKPNSPFSNFVDTTDPTRNVLSSADLFNRVYTTKDQLVFQTCIENEGEPSWGRLFVIATPAEALRPIPIAINQVSSLN